MSETTSTPETEPETAVTVELRGHVLCERQVHGPMSSPVIAPSAGGGCRESLLDRRVEEVVVVVEGGLHAAADVVDHRF